MLPLSNERNLQRFCYAYSLRTSRETATRQTPESIKGPRFGSISLRGSSVRHVEVLARRSEFSEDRRKTSRGICLSNLTEPTKPVVYTDRGGVAGRYPPTNYSLLFILFTRMRADALSHIYADRSRGRGRGRGKGEREKERAVQP